MLARIAFVLTTTLFLALAACGDDGPPDAADIYTDAGEKMGALAAYHVTVDGLDDGEAFTMELDLEPPDKYQSTVAVFEGDQVFEFSNIEIGDEFYQQMSFISDGWFLGSAADRDESGNFLAFANAIITEAFDLSYVGEEDVDGVATYHLQGTLAREVLELVETEGPLPETMAVELWVGKDDSLVRRYVLAPDDDDERSTLTFSRFDDETISIEAPSEVLTAEELEALFEVDFDTPEAIRAAIAELTDEERECLRGVVGDEAFAEFEAGVRVPHDDEMTAGEVCFPE